MGKRCLFNKVGNSFGVWQVRCSHLTDIGKALASVGDIWLRL